MATWPDTLPPLPMLAGYALNPDNAVARSFHRTQLAPAVARSAEGE